MPAQDDSQRLSSLRSKHADIERDARRLVESVRFTDELEAVARRQAAIPKLRAELDRLHARAWLWTAPIEADLAGIDEAAAAALRDARTEGDRASAELRPRADVLLRKIAAVQPALHMAPAIDAIDGERDALEAQVRTASDRIEALTRAFVERVTSVERALELAHRHADRFESASFSLLPEENPVAAVKATWEDAPEGKTEGMLYLSDLRVRFEAQQKVATRKFLFITTQSETVRKALLDEAVGHVAESTDSKRGLVIKDQLVKLAWSREAEVPGNATTFELDEGTAAEFDALVEEIRSGAIARRRRASPPTAGAPIGTPLDWPARCSACDAPIPPPVKGQTAVACPYCGQGHAVKIAIA